MPETIRALKISPSTSSFLSPRQASRFPSSGWRNGGPAYGHVTSIMMEEA